MPDLFVDVTSNPTGTALPPAPSMPTEEDQRRADHQWKRYLVLKETWDGLLEEWLDEHVDPERLEVWGPPDTSANPLVDIAAQLTTPGLYGRRPEADHPEQSGKSIVSSEGFLDQVRYFQRMQRIQFFTVGLNDFLVRWSVDEDARSLRMRLVAPHLVYARADADDPGTPVEIWEMRPRLLELVGQESRWIWAWDVFQLRDPLELDAEGNPLPSYKVIGVDSGNEELDGRDLSSVFLATPEVPTGRLVGEDYPFVDGDEPILPWTWYRSMDEGTLWSWTSKRGAFRGTLNTGLNWTYTQRAARDASGKTTIIIGAKKPGVQSRSSRSGGGNVQSIMLTPGAALFLDQHPESSQLLVQDVGPGGNLDSLSSYASGYELRQAVRWGLNPADVQRLSNNPMSGAALFVTSKGRRDFARQVQEFFRESDRDAARKAAALLTAAGVGAFPTTGYSFVYYQIPESPGEEKARRDQTDWDLAHGVVGPLDVVRMRRPGITDEEALRVVVDSEVQKRLVARAVELELSSQGFPGVERPAEKVELAPTDLASIVTVNEARAQEGLPPLEEGDQTISDFRQRSDENEDEPPISED